MAMRKGRVDPFDQPPSEGDDAGRVKGPAPAVVVDAWIALVRTIPDREALDSFTRRTWRDWEADSLEWLKAAILKRREELAGE